MDRVSTLRSASRRKRSCGAANAIFTRSSRRSQRWYGRLVRTALSTSSTRAGSIIRASLRISRGIGDGLQQFTLTTWAGSQIPGNQFSFVENQERLKHAFVVLTAHIAGSCFVPTRCETNRGTSSSGTESISTSRTENGRRRASEQVNRTWRKRRG